MATDGTRALGAFTWSIAEILRGHFKQSEYGRVVLPFVVLRRLDCLLESTKATVLAQAGELPEGIDEETRDYLLYEAAGGRLRVYNTSRFTFATLKGQEATQLLENLSDYITSFSPGVRDIFLDRFRFAEILKRLADAGVLWQVFERFAQIDLHPERVSNTEMGYLFEDLIRRFSEISNETAGEHFTPREVIRLIVDLVLAHDHDALAGSGIIRTVYDPAAGTGGMLALAEGAMRNLNSGVRVEL
jgi:type I restriction enzyme M protein